MGLKGPMSIKFQIFGYVMPQVFQGSAHLVQTLAKSRFNNAEICINKVWSVILSPEGICCGFHPDQTPGIECLWILSQCSFPFQEEGFSALV